MQLKKKPRCSHIIQPGELTIDTFDGTQCTEANPRLLTKCEECGQLVCLIFHWKLHLESHAKK